VWLLWPRPLAPAPPARCHNARRGPRTRPRVELRSVRVARRRSNSPHAPSDPRASVRPRYEQATSPGHTRRAIMSSGQLEAKKPGDFYWSKDEVRLLPRREREPRPAPATARRPSRAPPRRLPSTPLGARRPRRTFYFLRPSTRRDRTRGALNGSVRRGPIPPTAFPPRRASLAARAPPFPNTRRASSSPSHPPASPHPTPSYPRPPPAGAPQEAPQGDPREISAD